MIVGPSTSRIVHAASTLKQPRRATQPTKMFLSFGTKKSSTTRVDTKDKLLSTLKGLGRGADATEADKKEVADLFAQLEKLNPTKQVLSDKLSARWELLYTTSSSILGTSRPPFLRPFGPIHQTIDVANLTAKNEESVPFFNKVEASLTPMTKDKVAVQFETFYILGFIPVKAPASARGELQITYLDEDLRLSRGDKGNIFILKRK